MLELVKGNVSIKVNELGAELKSFVVNNVEYMWTKQEFWAKTSPILFPVIGNLRDKMFIYNDKEYYISNKHGFARQMQHQFVEKTSDSLIFKFESNVETRKQYPFEFKLLSKFTIKEDGLILEYTITNTGNEKMYYTFGTHPAFELDESSKLIFEKEEFAKSYIVDAVEIKHDTIDVFTDKNRKVFEIEDGEYIKDALMFEKINSRKFTLLRKNSQIEISTESFNNLALWKPNGAPFLGIENWATMPDFNDSSKKIEEKNLLSLEPGVSKAFKVEYTVK